MPKEGDEATCWRERIARGHDSEFVPGGALLTNNAERGLAVALQVETEIMDKQVFSTCVRRPAWWRRGVRLRALQSATEFTQVKIIDVADKIIG